MHFIWAFRIHMMGFRNTWWRKIITESIFLCRVIVLKLWNIFVARHLVLNINSGLSFLNFLHLLVHLARSRSVRTLFYLYSLIKGLYLTLNDFLDIYIYIYLFIYFYNYEVILGHYGVCRVAKPIQTQIIIQYYQRNVWFIES